MCGENEGEERVELELELYEPPWNFKIMTGTPPVLSVRNK